MADSETRPPALRLTLMGRFRLAVGDDLVAVASRRGRGLLGYLAFAGPSGVAREKLGGLPWSDRGESQARASLRQCLLELRGVLQLHEADPALDVRRDLVALDRAKAVSDVEELLTSLAQDDSCSVTAQLETIGRGELLEDVDVPGLFAEWRDVQRTWLEDRIAAGVQRHIELLEGRGDWTGLKALTSAYLHRDPLNEPVVAAAMRADAALASTTAARRRFRVLQAALERDYGVKPVGASREALSAISRQDAATDAEPDEPVPPPGPMLGAEAAAIPLLVAAFETSPSEPASLVGSIREEIVSGWRGFGT